ncbi:hypothetical protein VMT65_30575 [Nocardia sp. CDC153]|uniref:hypothetical protein n=1 Tax=Nocardia sp. CDC153 TaxID=3112167 RepID=UPI002DBD3419|nr:hypothetical protein [Nocardia sp. CDC153]MEC3957412.1 hypothetical protein [Nocardia sp. CDC153]
MTSEQFPAQPNPYPYDPFGAGSGYPGGPTPGKPARPQTVTYAFYLMLAGAVATVVGVVYGSTQFSAARETVKQRSHRGLTDSDIDTIVTVTLAVSVVFSLIAVGLWVWMAFANRAGKHWARVTATVFFAVDTLTTLYSVVAGRFPVSDAIGVLTWLIGLAAVILLWRGPSSAYFRPAPAYAPYPQGPYPTGPQGF